MGCMYDGGHPIWNPRSYEGIRPWVPRRRNRVQVVHPPAIIPGHATPAPIPAPQDADNDKKYGASASSRTATILVLAQQLKQ